MNLDVGLAAVRYAHVTGARGKKALVTFMRSDEARKLSRVGLQKYLQIVLGFRKRHRSNEAGKHEEKAPMRSGSA